MSLYGNIIFSLFPVLVPGAGIPPQPPQQSYGAPPFGAPPPTGYPPQQPGK